MSETINRNSRKVIVGVVSSDKMDKTITVAIERRFKHAKYKKYIRRHQKVHAQDSANDAREGDKVEICECRPLSKSKRWRLVRVVTRSVLPAGEFQ